MKLNCWEFFKCGRQPKGENVAKLGQCPVPVSTKHDGLNDGSSAGRSCWRVTGTESGKEPTCLVAVKIGDCRECGFFNLVKSEEGDDFQE
jgi:hypothetical protein